MNFDPEEVPTAVARVRERIAEAERRSGRPPGSATIVAAIKYLDAEALPALAAAGIERVAENRTDQLIVKQSAHRALFVWDFIGQLQSRKAAELAGRVELVHSLASSSAARRLAAATAETERQDVLVQVNVDADPGKAGVGAEALPAFAEEVLAEPRLRLRGLMTMPAFAGDQEASRPAFAALRAALEDLRQRHPGEPIDVLSMGTSQDFETAVEEGATFVRLGSVLYRTPTV
jgi:pyridoxal phosphate enzyme (YggS family)